MIESLERALMHPGVNIQPSVKLISTEIYNLVFLHDEIIGKYCSKIKKLIMEGNLIELSLESNQLTVFETRLESFIWLLDTLSQ